jgi:hypothetical protein
MLHLMLMGFECKIQTPLPLAIAFFRQMLAIFKQKACKQPIAAAGARDFAGSEGFAQRAAAGYDRQGLYHKLQACRKR